MKYKIGDKVKIKTWKKMEKEFGLNKFGNIFVKNSIDFYKNKEKALVNASIDRIVEISEIKHHYAIGGYYHLKDISNNFIWLDEMIECLYTGEIDEPIYSRFEILDIR